MTKQHDPKDERPKAPTQKPTIGRIVHFVLPSHVGPDDQIRAGVTAAAIVTGVYPDGDARVDLTIALPPGHPNGFLMARQGILLDETENPAEHTWHWPPRA